MTAWPQNDGVALDPRHPRALGVCDYCGQTYHLGELKYIFQWAGAQLQNQHFRVCCRCWDLPQEQLRSIILPPDPIPVADPRPEYYTMDNGLQGFVQNTLNPEAPLQSGPQVIQNGVTQGWALPIPALTFEAITIFEPFVPQKILSANANRTYLLVYNPEVYQAGIGRSTNIAFGSPSIVMCGCATALLQNASASPPANVWTGDVYAMGTLAGQQLFVWEDNFSYSLDFSKTENGFYIAAIAG